MLDENNYMEIKKIAVSNRSLSGDLYLKKVEQVVRDGAEMLVLREKDLNIDEYLLFAEKVKSHIQNQAKLNHLRTDFPILLHSGIKPINNIEKIRKLITYVLINDFAGIHFTIQDFQLYSVDREKNIECLEFEERKRVGVSIHSIEEATEVQTLGADYIIAGHIFETDCKAGIAPRGLEFLQSICESVSVPVYAIGGITEKNAAPTIQSGAAGVCIMSGYFRS